MYRQEKLRPASPGGVAVSFPAAGAARSGSREMPRFARLFAQTWSAYLAGWGWIVRSGYAPPGTLLRARAGVGMSDPLSGNGAG